MEVARIITLKMLEEMGIEVEVNRCVLPLSRSLRDRADPRIEHEQTGSHTGTTIIIIFPWDLSDHRPPPTSIIPNIMGTPTLTSWLGRCRSNMVFIPTTPPDSGGEA